MCIDGVCREEPLPIDARVLDAPPPDAGIDGAPADANFGACDLLDQSSCPDGWKCQHVRDGSDADVGPRCVPDGTLLLEAACTAYSMTEPETGYKYDECRHGYSCTEGTCRDYCATPTSAQCPTEYTCTLDAVLPQDVGVCTALCDPVSQIRLRDSAPNCGGAGSPPTRTCVGYLDGPFVCQPAINTTATHGTTLSPPVFLNSCAPFYSPSMTDPTNMSNARCTAYCRPAPTDQSMQGNANGLAGSGFTCFDRNAGMNTSECRYLTFIQGMGSPYYGNHTEVGFCFDFALYNICDDSDADNIFDDPCPRCRDLPPGIDDNGNTIPDGQEWGCQPPP
jgi:hypothetical protein